MKVLIILPLILKNQNVLVLEWFTILFKQAEQSKYLRTTHKVNNLLNIAGGIFHTFGIKSPNKFSI